MDERQATPEQMAQIGDALAAGKKIEAIKLYREASGMGLKEAKEFVEALEVTLRAQDPGRFANTPKGSGCASVLLLGLGIAWVIATHAIRNLA